jgi:hypothetical protein
MLGFKRHLEEKLKASDDMGDWVKDFQDSDAPQFKGKSQKKRQQMAVAAKLSAERNEEVELDEVSDKKLDAYRQKAFADQPSGDDGSDKYRKRKFGRDLAFAKQTGRAKVLATKESVEELDELKKSTLGSYIKRAAIERGRAGIELGASGLGSSDGKNAIKTMNKRLKGIKMASDRLTKESVEELDELKKSTLGSYVNRAADDISHIQRDITSTGTQSPDYKNLSRMRRNRKAGIATAVKKLTREEVELDEAADLRVTKVYNKFPKKATYAVHSPDRKYFKEFDNEADAKKHLETKKEEVELDQETQYEIVESYLLENNIDVDSLTEQELNELIGKAIGGAFKLGAKAVVGAARRMSVSGRADAAEKRANAAEKRNKDQERIKKAHDRLKAARDAARNSTA